MSYLPFGRRQVKSSIDKGSNPFNNAGNPTAVFHPHDLGLPQGVFEVQKATISGGIPGASFSVFIDTYQIDGGQLDQNGNAAFYKASDGEWIVTNQSEVYLYFTTGGALALLPMVTLWLVYDPILTANRAVWDSQGMSF